MSTTDKREEFEQGYFDETYGGSSGAYAQRATPNKWRSMSRFAARFSPSPSVALDAGCAEGIFLGFAREKFPHTTWHGVDVSEFALARARKRNPGVDIRHSPLTSLPFETAQFDLVTCFDVLEHIDDLDGAYAALARVTRPGGHLIVSVPVYDGPLGWVVHALDKDTTHVHKTSRRAWIEGALHTDFELLGWEGLWRYYAGRYWHMRGKLGRDAAPAIAMAWRRRRAS